jgi:hypothetical protein
MKRLTTLVLCSIAVLSGCKAKELAEKAQIAEALQDKGTMELMKEVGNDEYNAPEDGRLTDAQVQMYLKVREKEKAIALVAKAEIEKHSKKAEGAGEKSLAGALEGLKGLGSVADFMTADIRAAKELGFNTQEYLWVKGQILAASGLEIQEQSAKALENVMNESYAALQKQHAEATDETSKKMFAEMLAGYEKNKQEMAQQQPDVDPAAVYNRELLRKYENALNAFAHEMSKFEANPGETERRVEEIQSSAQQSDGATN